MSIKVLDGYSFEQLIEECSLLYDLIIQDKVVSVKGISGDRYLQGPIMSKLCKIDPSLDEEIDFNFYEGHFHDGQEKYDRNKSAEDLKRYIMANWHVDESPISDPSCTIPTYISMYMTKFSCGSENGKTLFVDREKMFEDMPSDLKDLFFGYTVFSFSGNSAIIPNFKENPLIEPDNYPISLSYFDEKMYSARNYPIFSKHHCTDRYSLVAHSAYANRLFSNDYNISKKYCEYVYDYLHDENNWIVWEWSEGDFIVWDNRNLIHSYSGGWIEGERIFNRADCGNSKLFLDRKDFV